MSSLRDASSGHFAPQRSRSACVPLGDALSAEAKSRYWTSRGVSGVFLIFKSAVKCITAPTLELLPEELSHRGT